MTKDKTWIITTSKQRPIRDIAKDLADAGLVGGRVQKEIGSITGSAGARVAAKLRKVPGVVDVAADSPLGVGPPDAPQTW